MTSPGDSEEWERFWKHLRAIENRLDAHVAGLEKQVQALQTDLDVERKRSMYVRRASGRNKWGSFIGAVIAVVAGAVQVWRALH